MAAAALHDRESLSCSVCLDVFRNPVTIPCGHSFCKDCITCLWDKDVRRCPQCKQSFPNKPALTDWLQMKEEEDEEDAEAHEVSCDSCTSRRTRAVQSCLTCVSSFCRAHLEKHNELFRWRKHPLTEATDLQSKTCSLHGRLMDVFCRTDQKCVCLLCALHEHKNHHNVSASEERADRQRKLMESREKFLQNVRDREKDFQELKQAEESITCSAQTAVSESERIFSEVLCSVQKTSVHVTELIAERQREELSHIEGLQEKVQQKISDLRLKMSELDPFLTTEDHIHFLQNYPSDCEESTSEESEDLSNICENPKLFFRNVELLLSEMQERLMNVTKETAIKIRPEKAKVQIKSSRGPAQRDQKDVFRFGEPVAEYNFSFQHVPSESTSVEASGSDPETCKHEDEGTLDYKPVVPLPDLVELLTGEEKEQVVFSHRAKLYRYDRESQQWKERGIGELKILQDHERRRARLVMRRKQVLKLCANHWITANMKLEPIKASEKAWTWSALDFADGDGSVQTLAVRFRLQETADAFKKCFEEAAVTSFTGAERDEDFEGAVRTRKGKLYPDAVDGHDAGAATETQNHKEDENNDDDDDEDDEDDDYEDEDDDDDDDDDDDEAVNHVELPSVEENEEETLFSEWTKLFLWDCDVNKWKSCGAGDIKVLFHPVKKRYRVFMCQEGERKVLVNHCITRTTHSKPVSTNANALSWTAEDYSDGDALVKQFAGKFKTRDLADSFTKALTNCQ